MKEIKIKEINLSNNSPMTIIAGLNVLEDEDMALDVAEKLKEITTKHNIPLFSKLLLIKPIDHLSILTEVLDLKLVKKFLNLLKKYYVPIITDIHEEGQIEEISSG